MQRHSLIVRGIWATCLLIGGLSHARTLIQHGLLWDYGGAAKASGIYWSSLTIIDPAVAALLFVRPKVGIVGTIVLITTNVIHNVTVTALADTAGDFLARAANPFIGSQIVFMVFVLATARIAWLGVDDRRQPEPSRSV
ncbi:MAG: hypothetical protein DCF31_12565 [Alphaproteobacteria bacterium]|nr:MAG: hypothetical protein DCF31_12565 [Alphaproteobacteria bacterium]